MSYQDKRLDIVSLVGKTFPHSVALWRDILSCEANTSLMTAIDISYRLLPDGSSALGKLLTIAKLYGYEPVNYQVKDTAGPPVVGASTPSVMVRMQHVLSSLYSAAPGSVNKATPALACSGFIILVLLASLIGQGKDMVSTAYLAWFTAPRTKVQPGWSVRSSVWWLLRGPYPE